jgi:hypothetical protein
MKKVGVGLTTNRIAYLYSHIDNPHSGKGKGFSHSDNLGKSRKILPD